jgi:hypothetical protein
MKLRCQMHLSQAPLFILGVAVTLVGWAMVHISARIERGRAEHPVGEHAPPGPLDSHSGGR